MESEGAPPEGALIGRTIGGRFTITEFLTEGGMGAIYRGTCEEEPGGVAIKVLSDALADSETFVRRFQREARTVASLKHRSTVRILDHGVDEGRPYIVMELVDGDELQRVLNAEGRLSEVRSVRLMAQICSALAAAHDLGVVHRDLKPENIMVLRDADPTQERVKVLDFGIAKIMSPEQVAPDALPVSSDRLQPSSNVTELTKMGTLIGTPEYMAPEQFRGEAVDARTDVYACGVLLHRMITGHIPLSGGDWGKTALQRMHYDAAPRPSALVPATHPDLDALIGAAIDCDPALRPQSARQLQDQLLALLPDLAETAHPLSENAAAGDRAAASTPTAESEKPDRSRTAESAGPEGAPRPAPAWSGSTLTSPASTRPATPRAAEVAVVEVGGGTTSPSTPAEEATPSSIDRASPDSDPESGHAMFHDVSGLGGALHRSSSPRVAPTASTSPPANERGWTPAAERSPWELPVGASALAAVGVGALVLAILAALLR